MQLDNFHPAMWFLLLVATVSVSAAAVKEKRSSNGTDLVDDLLTELTTSFLAGVPAVTTNGTLLLNELLSPLENDSYSIPANTAHPVNRTLGLISVRQYFDYGGDSYGGPFYPSGELGVAKNYLDVENIQTDLLVRLVDAQSDGEKAIESAGDNVTFKTLDDYSKMYEGQWLESSPNGTDAGVATNYTQDLYFSMQRLSTSPYLVQRLKRNAQLPFAVDDNSTYTVAGKTLGRLLQEGRLFYADHRDQLGLEPTTRYSAACDAYFYIDEKTGHFLPLAIRTNVGSNLIYTPLDSAGDWLLAKMMFNVNDFWYAQWNHLAQTHQVVQIVWMAAIRTLSHEHPVFAVLNRLTYEVFSISVLAQTILFAEGGTVDLIFPYSGTSANNYTNFRYQNGSGKFKANYFQSDLRARGLINSCHGPPLSHFPFYEDGKVIHDAIKVFMSTFVRSYYKSDRDVAEDKEIQDWVDEANGPAGALDFPSEINTIDTLVDILTHIAHLASTAHHAVNTNELIQVSSVLPFNPTSLYSPIPTKKNASTNPVEFLPPFEKVIEQLVVGSLFARPEFVGTDRTLIHMFNDTTMLGLMNIETRAANAIFADKMRSFSSKVQARSFDENGLSQGMPFVWQALDPNVAPYALTV